MQRPAARPVMIVAVPPAGPPLALASPRSVGCMQLIVHHGAPHVSSTPCVLALQCIPKLVLI